MYDTIEPQEIIAHGSVAMLECRVQPHDMQELGTGIFGSISWSCQMLSYTSAMSSSCISFFRKKKRGKMYLRGKDVVIIWSTAHLQRHNRCLVARGVPSHLGTCSHHGGVTIHKLLLKRRRAYRTIFVVHAFVLVLEVMTKNAIATTKKGCAKGKRVTF